MCFLWPFRRSKSNESTVCTPTTPSSWRGPCPSPCRRTQRLPPPQPTLTTKKRRIAMTKMRVWAGKFSGPLTARRRGPLPPPKNWRRRISSADWTALSASPSGQPPRDGGMRRRGRNTLLSSIIHSIRRISLSAGLSIQRQYESNSLCLSVCSIYFEYLSVGLSSLPFYTAFDSSVSSLGLSSVRLADLETICSSRSSERPRSPSGWRQRAPPSAAAVPPTTTKLTMKLREREDDMFELWSDNTNMVCDTEPWVCFEIHFEHYFIPMRCCIWTACDMSHGGKSHVGGQETCVKRPHRPDSQQQAMLFPAY